LIRSRDVRDRNVELFEIARTVDFGWTNIRQLNFVVNRPKFTHFSNVRGAVLDHLLFPFLIFDPSRDICNQSPNLSGIAPNFARFLPSQILGCAPQTCVPKFLSLSPATSRGQVWRRYSYKPKVIRQNALTFFLTNLRIFNVKKCWGTLVPDVMYVSKPWPFYTTCKNLMGQRPLGAEIWFS